MLGLVDRLDRRPPGVRLVDGDRVLLLGDDLTGAEPSLAGSAVAWRSGDQGGALPPLDLAQHTKVADLVRTLVADGVPSGVHDVATGGLGGALVEMAVRSGVGVSVSGVPSTAHLFSEAPSRVLVCVPAESVGSVLTRAEAAGVEVVELGSAGGDRLTISRRRLTLSTSPSTRPSRRGATACRTPSARASPRADPVPEAMVHVVVGHRLGL